MAANRARPVGSSLDLGGDVPLARRSSRRCLLLRPPQADCCLTYCIGGRRSGECMILVYGRLRYTWDIRAKRLACRRGRRLYVSLQEERQ
jgi:hypothetical protein